MNTMTMTVNQYQFEAKKVLRIMLIAMVLTVGALDVKGCMDTGDVPTGSTDTSLHTPSGRYGDN